MEFTDEERKGIEELLEESREMQRQNGNKTYTPEEIRKSLEITPEEIEIIEKLKKDRMQNNEKIYTEEEIYEMFGIEELLVTSLQEEMRDYNRN